MNNRLSVALKKKPTVRKHGRFLPKTIARGQFRLGSRWRLARCFRRHKLFRFNIGFFPLAVSNPRRWPAFRSPLYATKRRVLFADLPGTSGVSAAGRKFFARFVCVSSVGSLNGRNRAGASSVRAKSSTTVARRSHTEYVRLLIVPSQRR